MNKWLLFFLHINYCKQKQKMMKKLSKIILMIVVSFYIGAQKVDLETKFIDYPL